MRKQFLLFVLGFFFSNLMFAGFSFAQPYCSSQNIQTTVLQGWDTKSFVANNPPVSWPVVYFQAPGIVRSMGLGIEKLCATETEVRTIVPEPVCYDPDSTWSGETSSDPNGFCFNSKKIILSRPRYTQQNGVYAEVTPVSYVVFSRKLYFAQQNFGAISSKIIPVGTQGNFLGSNECLQYQFNLQACK
ncbi:MAG: hypothetical protein ACK5P5_10275 [Pseudobdellovibrionaceae bacterium]|jgi:hypothetical protein